MNFSEDWSLLAARIAAFKGAADAYATYRGIEKDTRGVLKELNREGKRARHSSRGLQNHALGDTAESGYG
jgi:hypothetical protein